MLILELNLQKIFTLQSQITNLKLPLRFDYFAAAQAGRADAYALSDTFNFGVNRTKIDVPTSAADIVRVTDRVPKLRSLAANITNVCHDCSPVGLIKVLF